MTHLRVPHPFVLLIACIVVATALSYVLPAGEYDRRQDPATKRNVVVAGSYHPVPPRPVGPFEMLIAVPKGMADAGSVIFLIFLAGGAFSVIDRTGAFRSAVHWLSDRFRHDGRSPSLDSPARAPARCSCGCSTGAWPSIRHFVLRTI